MTANGGVSGPVSTNTEKAFSQIGPALRFNSAGEMVGVGSAVDVGDDVTVPVGSGISLGRLVVCVVGLAAGAD